MSKPMTRDEVHKLITETLYAIRFNRNVADEVLAAFAARGILLGEAEKMDLAMSMTIERCISVDAFDSLDLNDEKWRAMMADNGLALVRVVE